MHHQTMFISTTPTGFVNPPSNADSTTSLGSLFQCLQTHPFDAIYQGWNGISWRQRISSQIYRCIYSIKYVICFLHTNDSS